VNEAEETLSTKSREFRLEAATKKVDCEQRKECTNTNRRNQKTAP
jgi:hypothetical protein